MSGDPPPLFLDLPASAFEDDPVAHGINCVSEISDIDGIDDINSIDGIDGVIGKFGSFQNSRHYQAPAPLPVRSQSASASVGTNVPGPRSDAAAEAAMARPESIVSSASSSRCIVVSGRQRGNPLLKFIRRVPWEYGSIVPDFRLGAFTCALFLSLKYHNLHPEYLGTRIIELGREYRVRVLLCLVDIEGNAEALTQLASICLASELTLVLAWSMTEAARYLETLKAYENKGPEAIQSRTEQDYFSRLTDTLTAVRGVNKTDAATLATAFGSVANMLTASLEELAVVPGLGARKVTTMYDVFNTPFKRGAGGNRAPPSSSAPGGEGEGEEGEGEPGTLG
ncbi:excision repair cross-complementing rodent repair deficiency [Thecamonas trahens ATCC 50062]|uniref:DNA excision repair protein ERCC-1 n=1 Tax=Thecamonas trahens ATCC 50062 TaxID=461836 RepID=A0A0L0DK85_THETB|nr:excision repair cross-complementing rodent repair deficiency [Thecamonas trahens ATCC 50062]KNC51778.1 excision repair cross-complementing rodent repair deficiency [Thecamonas trahens ATCC 50062]|eukprot:XP_013755651.1 excision repair cross-complementing rodent repair deficiency [Thecamonas trahens ATCC 50062]